MAFVDARPRFYFQQPCPPVSSKKPPWFSLTDIPSHPDEIPPIPAHLSLDFATQPLAFGFFVEESRFLDAFRAADGLLALSCLSCYWAQEKLLFAFLIKSGDDAVDKFANEVQHRSFPGTVVIEQLKAALGIEIGWIPVERPWSEQFNFDERSIGTSIIDMRGHRLK